MENLVFNGWDRLAAVLLSAILTYAMLVLLLRISGKRTLSKMNAFDLIVTVALGSILATSILSRDVSLAEAALALVLLVGLQFLITWTSVRVQWVRKILTGEPLMLLRHGEFQPDSLKRARVTEAEVRSAVRSQGIGLMDDVEAVVLETDGSLSVVRITRSSGTSSLSDVKGKP